jgi:hypothetical protein
MLLTAVNSNMQLRPDMATALVYFVVSALAAGDVGLWMGPGRKLIEKVWEVWTSLDLTLNSGSSQHNPSCSMIRSWAWNYQER